MPTFGRITVAIDGSPHSERALDAAIELAKPFRSTVTLVAVVPLYVNYAPAAVPPASYYEEEEKAYEKLLTDSADRVTKAGVPNVTTVRLRGLVVPELLGFLDQHASDLVVLGARGLSTGGRLFLGSTSDAVVHHVRSPVLIVKGPEAPA